MGNARAVFGMLRRMHLLPAARMAAHLASSLNRLVVVVVHKESEV
jgi:hypothetical protein